MASCLDLNYLATLFFHRWSKVNFHGFGIHVSNQWECLQIRVKSQSCKASPSFLKKKKKGGKFTLPFLPSNQSKKSSFSPGKSTYFKQGTEWQRNWRWGPQAQEIRVLGLKPWLPLGCKDAILAVQVCLGAKCTWGRSPEEPNHPFRKLVSKLAAFCPYVQFCVIS